MYVTAPSIEHSRARVELRFSWASIRRFPDRPRALRQLLGEGSISPVDHAAESPPKTGSGSRPRCIRSSIGVGLALDEEPNTSFGSPEIAHQLALDFTSNTLACPFVTTRRSGAAQDRAGYCRAGCQRCDGHLGMRRWGASFECACTRARAIPRRAISLDRRQIGRAELRASNLSTATYRACQGRR